ncbi:hypothetical protein ABEX44_11955 [Priestia megaterium]
MAFEIGKKPKDVPKTKYSKSALVLNGYCVETQVKCGPYKIEKEVTLW